MFSRLLNTPWKFTNELNRLLSKPVVQFIFAINRISWGRNWKFYGVPIIQKHYQSTMCFGEGLGLRSTVRSNPLGTTHPVIFCTWLAGASLEIGDSFGM